ncbi:2-hydroxychromene-2-carboxylate isomerase [Ferrovibrio xuzhouensis]|uniref:2-hydroxychromene-2-carboxylate isomerase n=1 Tax=Ferrovibrio xuzhouensis TaxID=1576914 RepID=A0ABV7VFM5_9PROT
MAAHIDYYFTPVSPWAYLGAPRFNAMVEKYGAVVQVMPVDLGRVFSVSGGLPLAKRAPQRQAYRMMELKRWREFLGMPLNLQPKGFPCDAALSSRLIIAARQASQKDALALSYALGRAVWAEERNISDPETLEEILNECSLDPAMLFAAADGAAVKAIYEADTQKAMEIQIFGAPTFELNGELFWGQDRLDFLERALAKA